MIGGEVTLTDLDGVVSRSSDGFFGRGVMAQSASTASRPGASSSTDAAQGEQGSAPTAASQRPAAPASASVSMWPAQVCPSSS